MALRNDYSELFFTYILAERRLSQNTFFAYKQDVEQLLHYLKTKHSSLASCKIEHIKNFLKSLKESGIKSRSLSRKISVIKALFNFMSERFGCDNIGKSIIFPKVEKKIPTYLSEHEIMTLFNTADNDSTPQGKRNKVMLCLLYASGMRVSELVTLTKDQIHFQEGYLKISGKGNKERVIPIPNPILTLLQEYLHDVYPLLLPQHKESTAHNTVEEVKKFVFITGYKSLCKPITRQSFWLILKKILHQAGIVRSLSPHSLRHSLATHLLKNGADLRSLQLLLGHASIATVTIYTHLDTSQLRSIYDTKHPRKTLKKKKIF